MALGERGAGYSEPARMAGNAPITAPKAAVVKQPTPSVQTYSPNTGWATPSKTSSYSNMAPIGSQATAPQGPGQAWNPAPAPAPAPAPYVPPAAVQGGAQWYNGLGQAGQQAQDSTWLAGDSDYTAQVAEYDKALQSFIDRIANQRKGFNEDATLATQSTERNQTMSLDNMGEDFGARGLINSGMFDTSKQDVNTRFNDAKAGIERIRSKNDTEAVNRESDYKAENQISRQNAQRSSLNRQSQRQALLDSMGGF